ncbi:ParA family protein [Vibrio nigripulchritudo FTn2]|uniref:ParA family protein n=1 Tax=Vibrio nigripulchritudo TaxID=28173 RepID=UPI0003B22C6A|nr:ParA family protein [Vibrio nigripulchritudo]BCL74157.1 chromosome partitioning protein ParA [Vibrio nigripulchritudo]CCN41403.1 ParA family protein [Vibrio nigripulchritudo FTn2]
MNIISVANQKGGVGKTTTAVNLTSELGRKKRTLLIDLDPQGNASTALTGETSFPFEETIAALFDRPKVVDLLGLIQPLKIKDVRVDNIDFVPADIQLSRVIETSLTKINRERILDKQITKLRDKYDYIILDTPPNLSLTTLNAIQSSDLVIIPVDAGAFSLNGISPLLEAIEEIKGEDGNYRILRNEVDSRNSIINEFITDELTALPDNTFEFSIRSSTSIGKANALSLPLRFFEPGSLANNDYRKLAQTVQNSCNT